MAQWPRSIADVPTLVLRRGVAVLIVAMAPGWRF